MRLFIRKLLQKVGYDIVKYRHVHTQGQLDGQTLETEYKWLQAFKFNSIIDIGANEGQFSEKMRLLFPEASISAFEPIEETYKKLQSNFSGDKAFKAYNIGLGESAGEFEFQKNEYTPSSSLLSVSDLHKTNFEYASKTKSIKVKIGVLDEVIKTTDISYPLLVKIDVQGFEDKVIKGGKTILQSANAVICEVSFEELYESQPLFDDIYKLLIGFGYKYAGSVDQLKSATNGNLQADAFFVKNDLDGK